MPQPGENQVLLNLKNGSKLTQLGLWLWYRHLLDGISQPSRDRFAAACMAHILRHCRPDLVALLIDLGASKTTRNISSESPGDVALKWRRSDIAALLNS
jgi:hypothetical protein